MAALDTSAKQLATDVDAINAEAEKLKAEARNLAAQRAEAARSEHAPVMEKTSAAIAEAQAQLKDAGRLEVLKAEIDAARNAARAANIEAAALSQSMDALDELKRAKMDSSPIPGMTVREGRVFFGEVPFERVNTAERVKLAFQISAMRSGALPFMILDNSELMDADTWQGFVEGAKDSGFQVVVAKVTDSPLSIEVIP